MTSTTLTIPSPSIPNPPLYFSFVSHHYGQTRLTVYFSPMASSPSWTKGLTKPRERLTRRRVTESLDMVSTLSTSFL